MPNYKESEINNQCGPIYVCAIGGKGVVRCPAFVKVKWKWLVRRCYGYASDSNILLAS